MTKIFPLAYHNYNCSTEGDWETFDAYEMDMWGGHLRFVFCDTEARDEEEIEARGWLAMQAPELAALATAKATLTVYKQSRISKTMETRIDGRYESKTTEDSEEWRDVTQDFHKKATTRFGWDR